MILSLTERTECTVSCLLLSNLVLEKYENLVSSFLFILILVVCAIMKHLSSCGWGKKFGTIIDVINQHVHNCRIKYSGDTFHRMLRSEGEHHQLTWLKCFLSPLGWELSLAGSRLRGGANCGILQVGGGQGPEVNTLWQAWVVGEGRTGESLQNSGRLWFSQGIELCPVGRVLYKAEVREASLWRPS